jgi:hypothetical protein
MARVHDTLDSLIGGVSQQPPAVRFKSQAEDIENAWLSTITGLTPRSHTKHVAQLYQGKTGFNRWHTIDRDRREKYQLRVGHNHAQAWGLTGDEYPVVGPTKNILPEATDIHGSSDWAVANSAVKAAAIAGPHGRELADLNPWEGAGCTVSGPGATSNLQCYLEGPGHSGNSPLEDKDYVFSVYLKPNNIDPDGWTGTTRVTFQDVNVAWQTSMDVVWSGPDVVPTATLGVIQGDGPHEFGLIPRGGGWYIAYVTLRNPQPELSTNRLQVQVFPCVDSYDATGAQDGGPPPTNGSFVGMRVDVAQPMVEEWDAARGRPTPQWFREHSATVPTDWSETTPALDFRSPNLLAGSETFLEYDVGPPVVPGWVYTNATVASSFVAGPYGDGREYVDVSQTSFVSAAKLRQEVGTFSPGVQTFSCFVRRKDAGVRFSLEIDEGTFGWFLTYEWDADGVPQFVSDGGVTYEHGFIPSPDDDGDFLLWMRIHPDQIGAVSAGDSRFLTIRVVDDSLLAAKGIYAWGARLTEGIRSLLWTDFCRPLESASILTVNDSSFLTNPGTTVGRRTETTPDDPTSNRAYVFVKNGGYDVEYTVKITTKSGTVVEADCKTWNGTVLGGYCVDGYGNDATACANSGGTWVSGPELETNETTEVAQALGYRLQANGGDTPPGGDLTDIIETNVQGNIIEIILDDAEEFETIEVEDSLGNTAMELLWKRVREVSDLPLTMRDGWRIAISGKVDDAVPAYVQFQAEAGPGQLGNGRWEESSPWETEDTINAFTLPHQLLRKVDLSQWKYFADSPQGVYFELRPMEVERRLVGDDRTNPFPAFDDEQIRDTLFFESRLGFLTGESLVMSETNQFFNYHRTTVFDDIDSDPVGASASHTDVSILNDAFVIDERLILTSDRTQFVAEGSPTLTNKSVSIRPKMTFESYREVSMVGSGRGVFMAYPKQGFADDVFEFSGVREILPSGESFELAGDDITDAVPSFIRGRIVDMTSSPSLGLLLVLAEDGTLYPFRYLTTARQVLQQAWSRWDLGAPVKYASIQQSEIILVVARPSGTFLETMLVGDDLVDDGLDFQIRLDNRHEIAADYAGTTYDAILDRTSITLVWPGAYDDAFDGLLRVVEADTGRDIPVIDFLGGGPGIIRLPGDHTGKRLFIGRRYTMLYQFTDPQPRGLVEGDRRGATFLLSSGKTLVLGGKVVYDKTAKFNVTVAHKYGDAFTSRFTSQALGTGDAATAVPVFGDGEFEFEVGGYPDDVTITLTTDSHLPCNILSGLWEMNHNPRSGRLRG